MHVLFKSENQFDEYLLIISSTLLKLMSHAIHLLQKRQWQLNI